MLVLAVASFLCLFSMCFRCTCYFVFLFLVVSISAIDCLERLVSKMTYYMSSGTLNRTNSSQLVVKKYELLNAVKHYTELYVVDFLTG